VSGKDACNLITCLRKNCVSCARPNRSPADGNPMKDVGMVCAFSRPERHARVSRRRSAIALHNPWCHRGSVQLTDVSVVVASLQPVSVEP